MAPLPGPMGYHTGRMRERPSCDNDAQDRDTHSHLHAQRFVPSYRPPFVGQAVPYSVQASDRFHLQTCEGMHSRWQGVPGEGSSRYQGRVYEPTNPPLPTGPVYPSPAAPRVSSQKSQSNYLRHGQESTSGQRPPAPATTKVETGPKVKRAKPTQKITRNRKITSCLQCRERKQKVHLLSEGIVLCAAACAFC